MEIPSWYWQPVAHLQQQQLSPYETAPDYWPLALEKWVELAEKLNTGQNANFGWKFGEQSLLNLSYCHPVLVLIAMMALPRSPHDFGISDGARTEDEQAMNVAEGVSKTMDSRHIPAVYVPNGSPWSAAFDFTVYVNGRSTQSHQYYTQVWQDAILPSILKINASCVWGMAWDTPNSPDPTNKPGMLNDAYHVELDRRRYRPLG